MTISAKINPWQLSLINAITDPKQLLQLLELDMNLLPAAEKAAQLFPLRAPQEFVGRMQKGFLNDPLLQQILPLGAEQIEHVDFHMDALQEKKANPVPGLLHKYHGRVLLILTGACAVNCRFCFRRHFPYVDNNPGKLGWGKIIDYITQSPSITEVIFSGGDPLVLGDALLTEFIQQLAAVPHLQRLRFHSRVPIVLPERITPELQQCLTNTRLRPILVVHCNHPQEINANVARAMQGLHGVTLLNQNVLLKGINDSAETLITLSEKLFAIGVLPYYLNVLDKIRGTSHFDVPLAVAKKIHWQMAQRLPGYLVPRLVCEQPGAPSKLSIGTFEFYTA